MRYNIFHPVHKGLRALLYDTALTLQQTDFSEPEETGDALKKVEETLLLFREHQRLEEQYILSAVFEYEPSVADTFRQGFEQGARFSRDLLCSIAGFRHEGSSNGQLPDQKLTASFVDFLVFHLDLMNQEEKVLNDILWRCYNDPCLRSLQECICQNRSPQFQGLYNRCMMRGISNSEIVRWMKAFEQSAAEDAFQALFATAEWELPEARLRKVLEALTEGMMLS